MSNDIYQSTMIKVNYKLNSQLINPSLEANEYVKFYSEDHYFFTQTWFMFMQNSKSINNYH